MPSGKASSSNYSCESSPELDRCAGHSRELAQCYHDFGQVIDARLSSDFLAERTESDRLLVNYLKSRLACGIQAPTSTETRRHKKVVDKIQFIYEFLLVYVRAMDMRNEGASVRPQ